MYALNDKGIKIEDPTRDARKAEREAARERRSSLLVTFHYNLGRDLLMLLATSPIFSTIKQNILSMAEKVFGNDPDTTPQHMNLIEVKTMEGADAHTLRLYVILNDNFYGKGAKELHASFDLSPLKYFWGIDQLILSGACQRAASTRSPGSSVAIATRTHPSTRTATPRPTAARQRQAQPEEPGHQR